MKKLFATLALSVIALWTTPSSAQSGLWWVSDGAPAHSCRKLGQLDDGTASCRYVYCGDAKCQTLLEKTVSGTWTAEDEDLILFSFPSVPQRSQALELTGIISPDIISPDMEVTSEPDEQHPSLTLTYTSF